MLTATSECCGCGHKRDREAVQSVEHKAGEAWSEDLPQSKCTRHQGERLSCIALREFPAVHQAERREPHALAASLALAEQSFRCATDASRRNASDNRLLRQPTEAALAAQRGMRLFWPLRSAS
jgi:hypothetical protein